VRDRPGYCLFRQRERRDQIVAAGATSTFWWRLLDSSGKLTFMFVIELNYKVDLKEIDAHMREHVGFLKKYYASGNFIASGRKIPRDGGIILAVGTSREQIQAIIEEDPFHARGLADVRIVEFRVSQRAVDVDGRMDPDSRQEPGRRRPLR